MTVYKLKILNFLLFVSVMTYGQKSANINPYYNGHLSESFNPDQTDFSKDYFLLRTNYLKGVPEITDQLIKNKCDSVWLRINSQNGIIGINYQRIKFKILTVNQDSQNPFLYYITGKSRVKENVCDFNGSIKIIKAYQIDEGEGVTTDKWHGTLFAEYVFNEDSNQVHSGQFKGILESAFLIDSVSNKIKLDTTAEIADGYFNNSFVGIWKEYKTQKEKKCIWGEGRLPFTFDFDIGDGEMFINDKYKNNGWQTFNQPEKEYIFVKDGLSVEKYKWWLTIK